ncbi:hypothetical protein [uncultured Corynebacterium sp.]|uniref:hypothetical protein n=1 Tax=uncultured Corynebacterium sp. TaxID=159447 RepID=UPI0025CEB83A|nr:hypothetical protein [uncultured Corynebacterium sp.]
MTDTPTTDTDRRPAPRRKGLLAVVAVVVVVIVTIAVIASMFGGSNEGHGAELRPQSLKDSLNEELQPAWRSEMCFVMMDKPRGLGAAPEDVPAEVPAINCLLDDGSPNGVSTTMVSDEAFANAVNDPADGVEMVELGSSDDGDHELSWLPETGLIYDVTPQSVLRFGPFADEAAARGFAEAHGLL